MADVKGGPNPLFLREEELRQAMELLFFAYRDFTGEPDKILAAYGFGRAHHRVIYFVGRNPGITVSELLAILRITKQSLSRVLGQLVGEGFITQRPGLRDRRQRLLELTDKGRELENKLSERQRVRVAAAYRSAGAEAVEGFRTVLLHIIDEQDRGRFERPEVAGRPLAGRPAAHKPAPHKPPPHKPEAKTGGKAAAARKLAQP